MAISAPVDRQIVEGVQVLTMKKITVLGAGSAGCRITGLLHTIPGAENLNLLAFDCDAEALKNCGLPEENLLLAGEKWRAGKGCGGKVNEGKTAAAAERETLKQVLGGTDMLIVTAGLGKGFGSGSMSVIQSVSSQLKVPTVFLLTLPFAFEGPSRNNLAEKTVKSDLLPLAGAVVTVPNDLLFCTLDYTVSHEEAFALADRMLAEAVLALAVTLTSGNRLATDYDTLSSLLFHRNAVCGIGYAAAANDDPEKERKVVENLLDSPLLGGSAKLKEADAVMMMLNGGENLSIGTAKDVFENISKYLSPEAEILTGAGAESAWGNKLHLVALTVKFDKNADAAFTSEIPRETIRRKKKNSEAEDEFQPELFSAQANELGFMERTTPVIVDGVNLDVPTFLRNNIPVVK